MKSDFQFCNICGHRKQPAGVVSTETERNALRIAPRALNTSTRRSEMSEGHLAHGTAISVLLSLLAIVPLTPWLSVFDGVLTVQAGNSDYMYGSYLTLLAVIGASVLLWDRLVHSLKVKKTILVGLGAGAFGITLHDYLEALRVRAETYSTLTVMEPGIGLYLAFAISLALIVVALLPSVTGMTNVRSRVTYAVRPDSPGSGPRAPL